MNELEILRGLLEQARDYRSRGYSKAQIDAGLAPIGLSYDALIQAHAIANNNEPLPVRTRDILRSMAQGATLGHVDEAAGALGGIRALAGKVSGLFRAGSAGGAPAMAGAVQSGQLPDVGAAYTEARDAVRGADESFAQDHPGLNMVSRAFGGVAGAIPLAAAAAPATIGGRIAAGTAGSAAMGALAGAGEAETMEDVPGAMLRGGTVGGLTGLGIGALGQALPSLLRAAPALANASTFGAAGRLLDRIAPARAARIAAAREARAGAARAGGVQQLRDATGVGNRTLADLKREAAAHTAQVGRQVFEPLEGAQIPVDGELAGILAKPSVSRLWRRVQSQLVPSELAQPGGGYSFGAMQRLRSMLRDEVGASNVAGRGGSANDLRAVLSELDNALEVRVPGFAEARRTYAQAASVERALDAGAAAVRKGFTGRDVARQLDDVARAAGPFAERAQRAYRQAFVEDAGRRITRTPGVVGRIEEISDALGIGKTVKELTPELRGVEPLRLGARDNLSAAVSAVGGVAGGTVERNPALRMGVQGMIENEQEILTDPERAAAAVRQMFSPDRDPTGENTSILGELGVGLTAIPGAVQGIRDVARDVRSDDVGPFTGLAALAALPFVGTTASILRRAARQGDEAIRMMRLEHYSPLPGLELLDPSRMGQQGGLGVENYERAARRAGHELVPHSFAYVAGAQPEARLRGMNKYELEVPEERIADISAPEADDIRQMMRDGQDWQRELIARGYAGYRASGGDYPDFVAVLEPTAMRPAQARVQVDDINAPRTGALRQGDDEIDVSGSLLDPKAPSRIVGNPEDSVAKPPKGPNDFIREVARSYERARGIAPGEARLLRSNEEIDTDFHKRIAEAYEGLPSESPRETIPSSDRISEDTADAYDAMIAETDAQYQAIIDAGYQIEFVDEDPYKSSQEMMDDLRQHRRLKVFAGSSEHPYLTPEQNVRFRAVHDFFGHAQEGNQFGPRGEENAFRIHSRMFTPTARRAMATETRGQNSWVNFGPHSDKPQGQRPFPKQKAALLPEEFSDADYPMRGSEQARIGSGRFYSRLQRAIEGAKITKASPQEWLNYLKKQPFPKDEAEYTGLEDILHELAQPSSRSKPQPVTREQLATAMRERGIRLTETRLPDTQQQKGVRDNREAERQHVADLFTRTQASSSALRQKLYELNDARPSPGFRAGPDMRDGVTTNRWAVYDRDGNSIAWRARREDAVRRAEMMNGKLTRSQLDLLSNHFSGVGWDGALDRIRSGHYYTGDADADDADVLKNFIRYLESNQDFRIAADVAHSHSVEWARAADELVEAEAAVQERTARSGRPQYSSYTEPGGDNYREIVVQLDKPPVRDEDLPKFDDVAQRRFGMRYSDLSRPRQNAVETEVIETTRQAHRGTYTSSHWDDIDNPLIHIRLKDRKGPNGERVLFIEEIQSDWHQAGRERGYARDTRGWTARSLPSTGFAKWQVLDADGNEVTTIIGGTEETAIREAASGNHVPSAPFKRTEDWLGLALRRVLDEAAQGGYTRVAWTTGAQQNRRYSLSQHVDHIEYDPDAERLRAWSDRTQDPEVDEEVSPDRLHEYIGRDAAERLLATRRRNLPTVADLTTGLPGQPNRGEPYGPHVLEGEDLEVGGNGMTTFYDEMIPRVLRDIAKKRGVEVPMGRHDADEAGLGVNTFGGARAQRTAEPLRGTQYIDVTPQLRERIRTRGQELYNLAPLAAGGAAAAAGAEDDKDGTNEAALSTVVGLGVMGAAGRRGQETIRRILKALPSAEHYQAAALAGQARRNWYTDSEKAIKTMFGDDAPLFTGLLAATSPRQQVPGNVRMTAELWAAWDAAGRPRDRRRVEALVNAYLPLPSHRNNAVRALIGEEVPRLSGSKVEPFRQNLSGNPEPVTNDAIMAATGRMNAGQLQGTRKTKDVVGRVTHSSPTYDAMQRRIQEAARALGGSWTPAEIQAATWSWARPELQGATRDLNPSLQSGGLHTPEDIDELPDFARLLVDNEHLQNYSLPAAPRAPRPDGRAPDPRLLADLVKNIRRSVLGQYF